MSPWSHEAYADDSSDEEQPGGFLASIERFRNWCRRMYEACPRPVRIVLAIIGYIAAFLMFIFLFALSIAMNAASIAAAATIYMVIGHAILRDAHLSGYEGIPISSSAKMGAIGGAVFAFPLAIVLNFFFPEEKGDEMFSTYDKPTRGTSPLRKYAAELVSLGIGAVIGAAAGPLGNRILQDHGVDGPMLDKLHAARAGALGGAIFGPGAVAAIIVFVTILKALPVEVGCWRNRTITVHG